MAKIKTLKDYNDEIIYPQSTTRAIVNAEGINLDTLHSKFVMTEQITNIEDIDERYETQNNKVTIVNNTSTDEKYPSAKAVYDAIIANKELGIKLEVVTALPTTGDSKIIYLISNNSNETQNIYDEYIYTNGWEKIGTTKVDLSNYATKDEIPTSDSFIVTGAIDLTTTEQTVSLGFTPRCVIVNSGATRVGNMNLHATMMVTTERPTYTYNGGNGTTDGYIKIVENGFIHKASSFMGDGESYGTGYRYVAFR